MEAALSKLVAKAQALEELEQEDEGIAAFVNGLAALVGTRPCSCPLTTYL